MALKANFDPGYISRETERQADGLHQRILEAFIRAGENFVTQCRQQGQSHELGQYQDITANLRNSIGYFVIHNGEIIVGSEPGTDAGPEIRDRLSAEEIAGMNRDEIKSLVNPEGYQLIGIAGMNYASYVESKGYNVISAQADTCLLNLESYLEKLNVVGPNYNEQVQNAFAGGPDNREEGI